MRAGPSGGVRRHFSQPELPELPRAALWAAFFVAALYRAMEWYSSLGWPSMAKIAIIVAIFCYPDYYAFEKRLAMATMNISLPDPMKTWVEEQARQGRHANASDYMRDLIRRDQERQQAIAALQAAVTEGVNSGEPQSFDVRAFKLRMRERHVVK